MKRAKESKTMPPTLALQISLEKEKKKRKTGKNDGVIEMINQSITATIDTVEVIEQQAEAEKAAQYGD